METTLLFYNSGFFGYGEEGNFRAWSLAHWIPLIIAFTLILLIYQKRECLRQWKGEESLRWLWAGMMLLVEMSFFWRLLYVGPDGRGDNSMMTRLPLQVCQWVLMVVAYMLMRKSEKVFSLTFFGTMSFGLLPLLLPAVITRTGPTYYRYYQYWLEHLMPIVGMYYMMFVHGFRPKKEEMFHGFIIPVLILPFALYFNARVDGAYYLYLTRDGISMLSFIPFGIVGSCIIGIALGFLLMSINYLIYRLVEKAFQKRRG